MYVSFIIVDSADVREKVIDKIVNEMYRDILLVNLSKDVIVDEIDCEDIHVVVNMTK